MFTRGYIWGIIMDDHNPWTGRSYWPLILSYVRNPVISMGRLWEWGPHQPGGLNKFYGNWVCLNMMEHHYKYQFQQGKWQLELESLQTQLIKESNFWAVALSSNLVVCTTANPKIHIYIYIFYVFLNHHTDRFPGKWNHHNGERRGSPLRVDCRGADRWARWWNFSWPLGWQTEQWSPRPRRRWQRSTG